MRKSLKAVAVIFCAALALCSCHKKSAQETLIGDWNLSSVSTKSATIGTQTVDVYLSFRDGGAFSLYQKTSDSELCYKKFSGTWYLESGVLSGVYSDGTEWGGRYNVTLSGESLTLESISTPSETSVFRRTTIPSEVIEGSR